MDCRIGEVEANRNKIVDRVRTAAGEGAEIAIFPECALTGYCFDSLEEAVPFAETADGPSAEILSAVAVETNVHIVAGFIEADGSRYYNAAILASPDGSVKTYRKVHLPYLGIDRFLTPGDRPFEVFQIPQGAIGINICYDTSFPESARVLKLKGAELLILPTNWPPGARRTAEFLIHARAHENHMNYAAVNRVGVERGWPFIGNSVVVNYHGDTVVRGSENEEEVLYADLDLKGANNNRIVNFAGSYEIDRLADRRPEFYGAMTEPFAKKSRTAG